MIRTFSPACSVKLFKVSQNRNGASVRTKSAGTEIDLTPLLGEFGMVRTSKSIRADMGGFSITLTDRMHNKAKGAFQDSVYGLAEPMDMIEIRMASRPHEHQVLPIVMRGFVSRIVRSQSMGEDGRPVRSVTITGSDYGKLLNQMRIWYNKNYLLGQDVLTSFTLASNYGIEFTLMPSSRFVGEILEKIVNKQVDKLWLHSALRDAPHINLDATVKDGTVGPFGIQPFEGTIWNMLRTHSDGVWNELFIEDREGGVSLVYRPIPYKDLDGRLIQAKRGAVEPGTAVITKSDIKRMDVMRSDDRVANYFWVNAPHVQLIQSGTLRVDALQGANSSYYITDHANVDPELYGLRMMEVDTEQFPTDAKNRDVPITDWANQRRADLIAMNHDNVVWEEGVITMRGNEQARAGTYLEIHDGALHSSYYVSQVDQTFRPFHEFITDVHVERGTGFIERNRAAQSPYLAERRDGVY